jgi:glucose-1-phosphate thymidylyltransferase
LKSLILASGFGTRLYPLTLDKPKGLLRYQGRSIISYIVDKLPPGTEILVSTNKKFEPDFRRWQETISRDVILCVEPALTEEQSLGAVGSLTYWAKDIADDLLVIAGDNYFEFDLSEFTATYDGRNTLVAVCDLRDKGKACHFGVVQLEGNQVIAFAEKPKRPRTSYVATACYLFPRRVLPIIHEFASENKGANLGNLIACLVARDSVRAHVFTQLWLDIGTPDSLGWLDNAGGTDLS